MDIDRITFNPALAPQPHTLSPSLLPSPSDTPKAIDQNLSACPLPVRSASKETLPEGRTRRLMERNFCSSVGSGYAGLTGDRNDLKDGAKAVVNIAKSVEQKSP